MRFFFWLDSSRTFPVTQYLLITVLVIIGFDMFFPSVFPLITSTNIVKRLYTLVTASLLERNLLKLGRLFTPPKLVSLLPLLRGGSAMLLRQAALNVAFVSATWMTQAMDSTGVSAAVYSITNTLYSLGLVITLAMQATGATLVPSALAAGGEDAARRVADRLLGWSTLISVSMALGQVQTIP